MSRSRRAVRERGRRQGRRDDRFPRPPGLARCRDRLHQGDRADQTAVLRGSDPASAIPRRWPISPAGSIARSPPASACSRRSKSPQRARPAPWRTSSPTARGLAPRISGGRAIAAIAEAAGGPRLTGVCLLPQPDGPRGGLKKRTELRRCDLAALRGREEAGGVVPWFEEICSVYPLKLKDGSVGSPRGAGPRHRYRRVGGGLGAVQAGSDPGRDSILADGRIASW